MKSNLYLLLLILIALSFVYSSHDSFGKDIRKKVIDETHLDEYLDLFCNEYCLGNQKKAHIRRLSVNKLKTGNFQLIGRVALQNRHVIHRPRQFVLYDHTVIVNGFGTLKPDTCELKINDFYIQNDFRDIFKKVLNRYSNLIGKKEIIPNCKRFIY